MGEKVTISAGRESFSAYVARPEAEKAPAVVVIQEIFGVNAFVRSVADRLAQQGYIAVAPDLFWRIEPDIDITDQSQAEWDKAFALYNAFDVDLGVKDIGATVDWAQADAQSTGKVGAVGFCLGGLLAYLTGTRTDVDAAVGYYGVGIEKYLGEIDKLEGCLLLHIAEEDGFVPKEAQRVIIAALKNHARVDVFTYPGRDHAFAREGGEHYDAVDAAKAHQRTADFFAKQLK